MRRTAERRRITVGRAEELAARELPRDDLQRKRITTLRCSDLELEII
jgi:hypothetical protein